MATGNRTGSLRGTLAATVRHHPDADTTELRSELAAARIAAYVEKVVAEAPPLTADQRARLAALLNPGTAA